MIACVCFGVGEAIVLFLCGLLGLCKLCAKKHLRCKDQHCHTEEDIENERLGFVLNEVVRTGKTVVLQESACPTCDGRGHLDDADLGAPATQCKKCKGKGFIVDGRHSELCDCGAAPPRPPPPPPPPPKRI